MNELTSYKGYTLKNGLWYTPYGDDKAYIRIFTIGGSNRIAEVSNYPRAYRDKVAHVYTSDTPFTVTKDDYNTEADDAYYDPVTTIFYHVGDTATHWTGDSLPGAFPRWLEYLVEQTPIALDAYRFPLNAVPKPIALIAASLLDELSVLTAQSIASLNSQIGSGEFVSPKGVSVERRIIYFHYNRKP